MVGGNDAISYSQPKTRSYYRQEQEIPEGVVTPEQFETAYRELLTKLQLAHVTGLDRLGAVRIQPDDGRSLPRLQRARQNDRARRSTCPSLI